MNREYFPQENMLVVPLCVAFPLLIDHLKGSKRKEALVEPWEKVVFLYRKGYSYTTLGQYERAFQTYLELLRLVLQHSSNTTKEKLDDLLHGFYRFFLFLGQKLLEDGSYALSLHYCSQMLEYFPKDSRLLKLIVKSQMALGFSHWEKVENNLKLLIKIEPQELRNYQNLGRFYESDPTTLGQAIKSYRKALSFCRHELDRAWFYQRILRLAPYDQKGWHRLGLLYLSRGMYIEAENCLEQAYRLGPGLSVTLDFVTTLIQLNKLERAEELLQQLEATFRQEKDNGEELLKSCFLMARVCEGKEYWCAARVLYSYCAQEAAGQPLAVASRQGIIGSYLEEGRLERAEELLQSFYQEEQDIEQSSYLGLIFELIDSLEKKGFAEKARDWRRKLTADNPAVFQQKNILLSQNKNFWRRYEVLEVLGTGTLGDTILCQERYKGGKVVVKEFKGDVFGSLLLRRLHNYLEMFKEMNIKQLAAFLEGAFWGENYLAVWEYLPDGNLRQHLRDTAPFALADAVDICLQIANTLAVAYSKNLGLCHFNLKPENIFLQDGRVKLVDFGLYKVLKGTAIIYQGEKDKSNSSPALFRSALYAAPERIKTPPQLWQKITKKIFPSFVPPDENEEFPCCSDLYSLGVILFEMLTAKTPYKANDILSLVSAQQKEQLPELKEYNPFVPEELSAIVTRLLAKDPRERLSSPGELVQSLLAIKQKKSRHNIIDSF